MVKNMSVLDRIVRIGIAAFIGIMILAGWLGTALAIILGIVALVLLLTGILGTCPAYMLFHFSTKKS
jgi:glucose uptake protein GlcU